jgi:hypothetical protein
MKINRGHYERMGVVVDSLLLCPTHRNCLPFQAKAIRGATQFVLRLNQECDGI